MSRRILTTATVDELLAAGEVVWQGAGALAGTDGWVSLHPAEMAPLTLHPPGEVPSELAGRVLEALTGGGSYLFRTLGERVEATDAELWQVLRATRIAAGNGLRLFDALPPMAAVAVGAAALVALVCGLLLCLLSLAKWRMPLHFDIGDKGRYQI